VHAQWCEVDQDRSSAPVTDRENLAPASVPMVSVAAWGEAWVNAQASAKALVVAWE